MIDPKKDEFNATLRRLIKQKPKPHDEMKKGREPKPAPPSRSQKNEKK